MSSAQSKCYAASRCCYGPSGCVHCHGRAVTGSREDNGYRAASRPHLSTQLQISKPNPKPKVPCSKHHTQKVILRESKVLPKKLHFKTGLTSPRPQSRLQTQRGCWRQRTPRRHGWGWQPDFVPAPIQRLRGGRSDWLQGSSWADALRGNHSIELKLEKQAAVSEAFRQDRQAVLSWGKNLFLSLRADGGLSRVGREGRRGKVDST